MANKKDNENKPKKTVVKAEKEKKKIVDLNPNNVVESLKHLLELAEDGKIDCFIFGGYSKNDEIVTSVCDTSVIDHQSLVGYLQSLATIRVLTEAIEITELD